jgi:hypothetical protein
MGYLPFLAVFGVFADRYGHTISQFEESSYQFDINVGARPGRQNGGLGWPLRIQIQGSMCS